MRLVGAIINRLIVCAFLFPVCLLVIASVLVPDVLQEMTLLQEIIVGTIVVMALLAMPSPLFVGWSWTVEAWRKQAGRSAH
ncbi:MAG: hypothetical protein HRU11_07640 [Parvularculaceae bacterium]|nr:hypothetical protein [Parvularculaceae bacterium]